MNSEFAITNYTDAISPKMFNVCGWQLKPFCLGHYILLETLNSPVVKDPSNTDDYLPNNTFQLTNEEQFDKLISFFTALLVCSMDFNLGLKALNDDSLLDNISSRFTKVLKEDMERPQWNYPREFYIFKQYIKYYFDIPPFETLGKKENAPSGTDWKQNIFVLFKKLGYSTDEILNMSFKRIFMEWTSEAESAGGIKVLNKNQVYDIAHPCTVTITTRENK